MFHAGHSLCLTQIILCVANRTSFLFQSRRVQLPLFGEFGRSSQDFMIRCAQFPGRSAKFVKKWHVEFLVFFLARFFRKPHPKLRAEIFAPKAPRQVFAPKGSRRKVHAERFTLGNFQKGCFLSAAICRSLHRCVPYFDVFSWRPRMSF